MTCMMVDIPDTSERLATQRSAIVVFRMLRKVWTPTTAEVASFFNISISGAARLLYRISETGGDADEERVPLYRDEQRKWRILDGD